jgi:EmrB/QacA subfamily drug resistance transporter
MDQSKLLTFIGILLALFLGAIDQTIVATALPRIVQDLQGLERYTWVATSYLVASTVLVPVYGKLADMYSRKKIELVSVCIFLTGSFLCGVAGEFGPLPVLGDGMSQLIIFRAIQGFGGAGLFSMAFIIIADLFPPAVRGKYQGYVGAVFGLASVLGPWIGGLLTDHGGSIIPGIAGWRWVFYVNIPFGAIALWFIIARMPPLLPKVQGNQKLDYLSALLLLLGLVPLMIGLQLDKTVYTWTSPVSSALFAVAAFCLFMFYFRSVRSENPILNLKLFSNKVFSTANAATFLMGASFMGIVVFLPLFMVNVVGVSATKAGVSMIPLSMGMFIGSIVSGQLVSRFGNYKIFLLGGIAVLLVGMYLLSGMTAATDFNHVLLYTLICGLGIGPTTPLYTLAIQNSVPVQSLGQATSANQFFRQMGSVTGIAVMGALMSASLSGVTPTRDLFAGAITHNYSVIIFLAVAAFVITLFVPQLPLKKTNSPVSEAEKSAA